ncbi:MAG: zinc ABC transporter substrate-binding protein [Ruminococcaceae bacterium]|nr:zinc ABC transporter substrate-binding protein [Oscillospiraceae bacterium]
MKKLSLLMVVVLIMGLTGCAASHPTPRIMATTKPVYDFTTYLCEGTNLSVGLLIDESVSCLHDYSLSVGQVRNAEGAELIVISGAGLEEFMDDLLADRSNVIDSSFGISLPACTVEHDHDHHHEIDSHIWLSPAYAAQMAENIYTGLRTAYPEHTITFQKNLAKLREDLQALQEYGQTQLQDLSCREMVTFHDGFGHFAHAFDLTIAAAMEEESGSEASAKELIHLIELIQERNIPAIFTEVNGSASAAKIISAEIDIPGYALDMGMTGDYFEIMKRNIDTVKEALG